MAWRELLTIAEDEVAATFSDLPAPIRKALSNTPVLFEQRPSPQDLADGIEPDTLGYFDEDENGVARIRLWLENIHDFAEAETLNYRDEVRTTLLHEIGHLLGWHEADVEERGLG